MAERAGFEPTVVFSYSRFPGVRLKPLSHLSAADAYCGGNFVPVATGFYPTDISARNVLKFSDYFPPTVNHRNRNPSGVEPPESAPTVQ